MNQPDDRYATMRQIGRSLDMTSHEIGRVLRDSGWRNRDGSPTMSARNHGWAIAYALDCGGYAWKWKEQFVQLVVDVWKAEREERNGKAGSE